MYSTRSPNIKKKTLAQKIKISQFLRSDKLNTRQEKMQLIYKDVMAYLLSVIQSFLNNENSFTLLLSPIDNKGKNV